MLQEWLSSGFISLLVVIGLEGLCGVVKSVGWLSQMTKLGGMPGTKSARVFVAKLPPGVTDEMFNDYFAEFGELVDAYMPKDRTRQHYRGIGFVHFKKEADAEHVVSSKHR